MTGRLFRGAAALLVLAPAGAMPLQNGDFTEGARHWQLSARSAQVADGVLSMRKEPETKAYPWAMQTIQLVAGEDYELVFEFRGGNLQAGAEARIEFPKLKTGVITPLSNFNTTWNPRVIPFRAQDAEVKLVFRVWSKEALGGEAAFRRIAVRPAGELLPPWKRMASPTEPEGFQCRKGALRLESGRPLWSAAADGSELAVTTAAIRPEADHRFRLQLHSAAGAGPVRWRLEPLALDFQPLGELVGGEWRPGLEAIEKTFRFPSDTVFVRIRLEAGDAGEFEIRALSLKRLSASS